MAGFKFDPLKGQFVFTGITGGEASLPAELNQVVISQEDFSQLAERDPNTAYLVTISFAGQTIVNQIYRGDALWWDGPVQGDEPVLSFVVLSQDDYDLLAEKLTYTAYVIVSEFLEEDIVDSIYLGENLIWQRTADFETEPMNFVVITLDDYNALAEKDPDTFYMATVPLADGVMLRNIFQGEELFWDGQDLNTPFQAVEFLTQNQYDQISTPNTLTNYVITEDFLGVDIVVKIYTGASLVWEADPIPEPTPELQQIQITQEDYDNLATKDENTLYLITRVFAGVDRIVAINLGDNPWWQPDINGLIFNVSLNSQTVDYDFVEFPPAHEPSDIETVRVFDGNEFVESLEVNTEFFVSFNQELEKQAQQFFFQIYDSFFNIDIFDDFFFSGPNFPNEYYLSDVLINGTSLNALSVSSKTHNRDSQVINANNITISDNNIIDVFFDSGLNIETIDLVFIRKNAEIVPVFTYTLPITSEEKNIVVDWGDGTPTQELQASGSTNIGTGFVDHVYPSLGEYTVVILGNAPHITRNTTNFIVNFEKITTIESLNFDSAGFFGLPGSISGNSLIVSANEIHPNFISLTNLFRGRDLGGSASAAVGQWDVSSIRSFRNCFSRTSNAPSSIANWRPMKNANLESVFEFYNSFDTLPDLNDWAYECDLVRYTEDVQLPNFGQGLSGGNSRSFSYAFGGFGTNEYSGSFSKWSIKPHFDNNTSFQSFNLQGFLRGQVLYNEPVDWIELPFYSDDVTRKSVAIPNMFNGASSFNQSLTHWRFDNVSNAQNFLNGSAMSVENYSNLLIWIAQHLDDADKDLRTNVNFGAQGLQRNAAGTAARNRLINERNWTITDGGEA